MTASSFIPELKTKVSLLLHDTCDRTLLLGKCLVLVGYVMKRGVVEWLVVVERRGELEHRGRDLLLLSFTSFMTRLQTRRRGVNTRKVNCERLQRTPWWVNSRRGLGC